MALTPYCAPCNSHKHWAGECPQRASTNVDTDPLAVFGVTPRITPKRKEAHKPVHEGPPVEVEGNALVKLTQAERWLAEAKSLDDLKQIHDIATAAKAYAQAHRLGLEAENHAMEIRLLAARRIGELMPEEKRGGKPGRESKIRSSDIAPQRLTEFRKLAEIPLSEFKERIELSKARQEKITYNKMLRGDWYQQSEEIEWETPQWLFDLLNAEFSFKLDVCASSKNRKCEKFFTRKDDGLIQPWGKESCWMNPPYGREIAEWMEKAGVQSMNGARVVCLVPARPDTEWWWKNCIQGEIRFLRGRLKWPGSDTAAPFPSAVVVLGKKIQANVVWWDVQPSRASPTFSVSGS